MDASARFILTLLNAMVGVITIGIGAWVMYNAGVAEGLLTG